MAMNQPERQTVGQKLRQAREEKGVSLAEAARATHIRANYLQELESDHPELFNSAVQARGFLRLYAAYLELPAADLMEQWEPLSAAKDGAPAEAIVAADLTALSGGESEEAPPEPRQEQTPENEIAARNRSLTLKAVLSSIKDLIAGVGRKAASLGGSSSKPPFLKFPKQERDEQVAPALEYSGDIFVEIGNALKSRRQKMDLDLIDAEHFTNIKRIYLLALEEGRFADLPSSVQGRGMLNNYAQFLAMDENSIMERYVQALQLQREERALPARKQAEPPVSIRVNIPEGVRRVLNPDLVVGGALILGLFGFILWGAAQILVSSDGEATEAPSISEMLRLTPSVSPPAGLTPTGEGGQPAGDGTPIPGVAVLQATPTAIATVNAAPLQLYIIAKDRAYLKVTVDGRDEYDGRVAPDNAYTFSGNTQITLLSGNAAALEVYFNQDYLGALGAVGEVVNLSFTPAGLKTAAPQAQPTLTLQPRPTQEPGMMDGGN